MTTSATLPLDPRSLRSIAERRWPLLRYTDLVRYLVKRDLAQRYRRSFFGVMWTMMQPLMMMAIMYVVFSNLFGRGAGIRNFPVYVLSGILFYNFFSQGVTSAMNSLFMNRRLILQVPTPTIVFPVASILSGLLNLLLSLVPLFAILLVTRHPITPALLFLPVPIFLGLLLTAGFGLALAPLSVFFRDVVELVQVGLRLLFYLTPIMYPISIVPEQFRWMVRFNPVRSVLEVFRDPIHLGKLPPLTHFAVATGVAVVSLVIGLAIFRRMEKRIPFYI